MIYTNAQRDSKQRHKSYTPSKPVTIKHTDSVKAIFRPKLKIGQPGDKYEQEADRVAEQVMRMPEPHQSSLPDNTSLANSTSGDNHRCGTIQRICQSCTEDETLIQTKTSGDVTPEMTPSIGSSIQSLQGSGRPLSGSVRSFFEPRFGTDFSNVRVHNDTRAASVAQSVNARAFTLGHNVVFGAGEYSPDSLPGKKLLAHELTHVMQQNSVPTIFSAAKNSENTTPDAQKPDEVSPELSILQTSDTLQAKEVIVTTRPNGSIIQRQLYEGHDHGGRYVINDEDCTYRYHQNWFFDFRTNQTETEREQYMEAARQQIQNVWSGKFPLIPDLESCGCYPNGFNVTVEMHPHERERSGRGFTAIVTTTERRGFTNQPLRNIDLGTRHEQPLNMGRGLSQQRVAHEFGHTIGLTDEYHGWAGLFNTRGSRDRPSIMHSGDQVRPRHYQHFADMINLEVGSGCTYSPAGRRIPAYENPVLSVTGIPFTDLTPRADFIIGLNIDRRMGNSAILGLVYPTSGLMSIWNPEGQTSLVGPTVGLRLNQIAHPLYVNVRTGVLFDPVDPSSVAGIHIPIAAELGIRQEGFQAGINYTAISNVLGSGGWTHIVGVGVRVELPNLFE